MPIYKVVPKKFHNSGNIQIQKSNYLMNLFWTSYFYMCSEKMASFWIYNSLLNNLFSLYQAYGMRIQNWQIFPAYVLYVPNLPRNKRSLGAGVLN